MQKQMSYKKIIICICAVAVVIAAAVIILLLNKEEAYRSILVYEVEGTAVIERESVGSMNAAENLYLESGDRVSVAQDSSMRMKLDDDKYVMAEADTIFSVEAEGTDENSKTRICLEQGAVTNEIQHPLSEGSQYETSTPNSVMAVRGTIYRAELFIDENGDKNTKLCCFQGKVGATPILPDGTYGEEILVPAGSELIIYSDGTVDGSREIMYEALSAQALQVLKDLSEGGQSITGITPDELDELLGQAAGISEAPEADEPASAISDEAQEDVEQSDADGNADLEAAKSDSQQTERDAKNTTSSKTTASASDKPSGKNTGKNQTSVGEAEKPSELPGQKPQTPSQTQPNVSEPSNSGSSDEGNGSGDGSQGTDNGNDSGNHDTPGKDTPKNPPKTKTYTVTFEYQGTTFATQKVKSGETVLAPMLVPAKSGEWDFDFGTKITADMTVRWK